MSIHKRIKTQPTPPRERVIMHLISPLEKTTHEICHAVHVISTEEEGENAHQGVSFNGRRSGLAKPCT